jgi:hypothetical protein
MSGCGPKMSNLLVGFQIHSCLNINNLFTIRRNLNIGEPLDLHQVFEGDGTHRLRCYPRNHGRFDRNCQ